MEAIAQYLAGTPLNDFVISSYWMWPLMEIVHFIGLSLLIGALLLIDLRLAGFFRQINITATHKLLPWVFVGFAMNIFSGVMFIVGDPLRYSVNIAFRIKMILVLIAGLNALWYYWKIDKDIKHWDAHGDTPALAKTIALISLVSWTGILLLGRLIPYIGTG